MNDTEYVACWKHIETVQRGSTKPDTPHQIESYLNPKPLQRQNIDLVCNIFNDKTCAALTALNVKLKVSQGTVVFVKLIHDWYKMMSIKSKYAGTRFNDLRKPWSRYCDTYQKLLSTCIVIATCKWEAHRGRQKKLTKFTADTFINTTKANIVVAIRYKMSMISNMSCLLFGLKIPSKNSLARQGKGWVAIFILIYAMQRQQDRFLTYIN